MRLQKLITKLITPKIQKIKRKKPKKKTKIKMKQLKEQNRVINQIWTLSTHPAPSKKQISKKAKWTTSSNSDPQAIQ